LRRQTYIALANKKELLLYIQEVHGRVRRGPRRPSYYCRGSDSSGQPYPIDYHDRQLTEDDDVAADTYDSDADAAAYGGDEL